MTQVIEKYEAFDAPLANRTIGHHFADDIVDVDIADLGEGVGLMSSIARAQLTFSSGERQSVVVKCIARTDNSDLSKGLNFYRNEVNFYLHLAEECPVAIPRCLYAAVDPDTQDFLLVLEDLGEETAGDQLLGCTEEEMRIAFQRAGQLHGHFWGRTTQYPWLNYQVDMKTMLFRRDSILRPGIEPAIERFPEFFSGNRAEIARKIGDQYLDLFTRAMAGEPTIVHGDYRVDNLFLVDGDKGRDIIAFDWQNTMGGNGTHDIGYFSSGSCGPELRGETELSILRDYHQALLDRGVQGYSFDECLEHYRYNLLITMITPIAVCGTLDQGNERGVRLGETMLDRAFTAIESLSCDALLK